MGKRGDPIDAAEYSGFALALLEKNVV